MKEKTDHKCDTAVMINMKERHLTIRLTENKQEGIGKLPVLLQIEDVDVLGIIFDQHAYMSNSFGILSIKINITAIKERFLEEVAAEHSIETVGGKTNTDEIIDNHKRLGIETLSLFHEFEKHENHDKVKDVANHHGLCISERETINIGF